MGGEFLRSHFSVSIPRSHEDFTHCHRSLRRPSQVDVADLGLVGGCTLGADTAWGRAIVANSPALVRAGCWPVVCSLDAILNLFNLSQFSPASVEALWIHTRQ